MSYKKRPQEAIELDSFQVVGNTLASTSIKQKKEKKKKKKKKLHRDRAKDLKTPADSQIASHEDHSQNHRKKKHKHKKKPESFGIKSKNKLNSASEDKSNCRIRPPHPIPKEAQPSPVENYRRDHVPTSDWAESRKKKQKKYSTHRYRNGDSDCRSLQDRKSGKFRSIRSQVFGKSFGCSSKLGHNRNSSESLPFVNHPSKRAKRYTYFREKRFDSQSIHNKHSRTCFTQRNTHFRQQTHPIQHSQTRKYMSESFINSDGRNGPSGDRLRGSDSVETSQDGATVDSEIHDTKANSQNICTRVTKETDTSSNTKNSGTTKSANKIDLKPHVQMSNTSAKQSSIDFNEQCQETEGDHNSRNATCVPSASAASGVYDNKMAGIRDVVSQTSSYHPITSSGLSDRSKVEDCDDAKSYEINAGSSIYGKEANCENNCVRKVRDTSQSSVSKNPINKDEVDNTFNHEQCTNSREYDKQPNNYQSDNHTQQGPSSTISSSKFVQFNPQNPPSLHELLAQGQFAEEDEAENVELQHSSHDSTESSDQEDHIIGMCIECEENPAVFDCIECDDEYCEECFIMLHRKGHRAEHQHRKKESILKTPVNILSTNKVKSVGNQFVSDTKSRSEALYLKRNSPELRLIEACLNVSNYTDEVDAINIKNESKRKFKKIQLICSFMTSLALGQKYHVGKKLIQNSDFARHNEWYTKVFELARRYKIMNPALMHTTYAKLIWLLQDALSPDVQELLGFNVRSEIVTVYSRLKEAGCVGVLTHTSLATATMEILPEGKSRAQLQKEIKSKERAQDIIARQFANENMSRDDIKWCLYSMSDNNSFLRCDRFPIDYMIACLQKFFDPDNVEDGLSLAISAGTNNSRLTHSHRNQYQYVLQSLTLWREILDDMFRLWYLAEQDLLDEKPYKLTDTGQGLQRIQPAPRIYSAMRAILHKTQQNLGSWVGSSVIHLGDNNVPNAFFFIDKYNQVAKVLGPIVQTLKAIPAMYGTDKRTVVKRYIDDTFDGPERLQKIICHDFFSRGFDGSGADNFYDAGSCIDGRLTSAWNWCNELPKKQFYPIFCLAGFTSFEGSYQD